jgi:uncharacterized membrane protein YhaH (DUF805 family)
MGASRSPQANQENTVSATASIPTTIAVPWLTRMGRVSFLYWISLLAFPALAMQLMIDSGPLAWSFVMYALISLPALVLVVRRLRDLDMQPGLAILWFAPLLGQLFVVLLVCMPGTCGPNHYGIHPPRPTRPEAILAPLLATMVIGLLLWRVVSGA